MAELNFPANPQIDDEYTFNNLLYKYDGEKWTTWGSGANTALDLKNDLASPQGASMVVTASGNTVQEELDMAGSGLSLEPLRRSYAEAGFDMDISESFTLGGTLNAANEVLLGEGLIGYSWGGTFPKVVPPNSTPLSTGGISSAAWIDQSNNLLRAQAKSYIDNGFVAKAGGAMTGALSILAPGEMGITLAGTSASFDLNFLGADGIRRSKWAVHDSGNVSMMDVDQSTNALATEFLQWNKVESSLNLFNPKASFTQGTEPESFTRKDYVDGGFISKTGNGTIAGDFLTVKKSATHSGVRLYAIDTESLVQFLNDDGFTTGGLGANTETGLMTLTRSDPVNGAYKYTYIQMDPDGGIAAADATVRLLNPESMTAQGTLNASLTRKDYVDSTFLPKAGGTIAGILTVQVPGECGVIIEGTPTTIDFNFIGEDGIRTAKMVSHTNGDFNIASVNQADNTLISSFISWQHSLNTLSLFNPITSSAQQTAGNALTRKDYVDAALLVKADVDRVNTLEATITALLARIEVLESINNTPTA